MMFFMMIFVALIHLNKSAADMTFSLRKLGSTIKSLKAAINSALSETEMHPPILTKASANENNLDNNDWNSKVAGSSKPVEKRTKTPQLSCHVHGPVKHPPSDN
jgi:hypothetical protein